MQPTERVGFRALDRLSGDKGVQHLSGVAQIQDTNLVNAWGLSSSSSSPFWVSDNGTGIAPQEMDRIFEYHKRHVAIQFA